MTGGLERRLARLLARLSLGPPQTLAALEAATGDSRQRLRADLDLLIAAGYPIEGSAAEGWQLVRELLLPELRVTAAEREVLAAALAIVAARDPAAGARLLAWMAAGVEGYLPGMDLPHVVAQQTFPRPYRLAVRHLPALRRAIRLRRPVVLDYADAEGRPTRRDVRPLALERWGVAWALIGWCALRGDFRNFRLDRILSLEVLPGVFPPEPGREWADFAAVHRADRV
ncbi:MAG: helix-turn-helix transcriptional regulator [Gemmobacter sp.]|uniref:helix-turn-helix transcriptional regulator n=1 Tax=Gemmobacter sp. TaxID=1898957 RepID=UPI003919BBDD